MSMARLVVAAVLAEGRSKSEVARDYGVSRRWVDHLVQRFLAEGETGLEPRSRRPKRIPGQSPVPEAWRRDRRGAQGARRARPRQRSAHDRVPPRTPAGPVAVAVDDLAGAHPPRVHHPRAPQAAQSSSYIRFEADQPNERWQLDITHWTLADRHRRRDPQPASMTTPASWWDPMPADVQSARRRGLLPQSHRRLGVPGQMLSDNGAVFTGIPRCGGRSPWNSNSTALGVTFRHSRPYHPQTCGKVERFHQTQKSWLAASRRPAPALL